MGKAARNRKLREAEAAARRATMRLLERLLEITDAEAFSALVTEEPELLGDDVIAQVRRLAQVDRRRAVFRELPVLLRAARADPLSAFAAYAEAVESAAAEGEAMGDEIKPIDVAYQARRFDEVIQRAGEMLQVAHAAGDGSAMSYLHRQRGLAYFNREAGDRAANLDAALDELGLALAAATDSEQAADVLMHAGLVVGEHVRGDPGENLERSVELLRSALDELDADSPPDLLAIVRTNLARALLRREKGDRIANLREAQALCESALEYRSPDQNAYDWAHTQGNLGDILFDLADLGELPIADAVQAYEEILGKRDRVGADWLVGVVHYSLGRLHRKQSELNAERLAEAEDDELDELLDPEPGLRRARDHLIAAIPLTRNATYRGLHGRALAELALVLAELDESGASIDAAREALSIAQPSNDPRTCAYAAETLGSELIKRGTWSDAADAYRVALAARELMFHGRLDTEAREQEIRRAGNVPRWAAFAMARSGSAAEAVVVLEASRTRELRRRLSLQQPDEAVLARLPRDIRTEYRSAARALAAAPMGEQGRYRERRFQEVLSAIRTRPGFERFGTGAEAAQLDGAAEPGWPIIYVNPTPAGTLLLTVASGDAPVQASFLDQPTSSDIFMRLLMGDAADDADLEAEPTGSFLFGLTPDAPLDRFRAGLEEVLPWIGDMLARPVRDAIHAAGGTGATLILCGPLSATPFHAATWRDGGQERCLLDTHDIRYGQSAALAATTLQRAQDRATARPHLLALADPVNNLQAARPEVDEIAQHFGANVIRADGDDATLTFLQQHARSATHVHLACHARGGFLDAAEAGVELAGGPVPAADLTRITGLQARLVVVSACESAVAEMAGLPDEVFSIGMAMLAAGSACAVASLWSVDDMATALLMTRFYEEMLQGGLRPPEALRRAQMWLRDLSEDEELEFLARHPALDIEFRRRSAAGDRPGRRGSDASSASPSERRWYAHPDYWAPFIAIGA